MLRGSTKQSDVTAPGVDWPQVFRLAADVFQELRHFHHPEMQKRVELSANFVSIAGAIREYAVAGAEDLAEAWDMLRRDQHALDIILGVTSAVLLETGLTVAQLAAPYAKSVHAIVPRGGDNLPEKKYSGYMTSDLVFVESLATEEELRLVLEANPWALTLLLLRRSGILHLARPGQVAEA